MATTRFSPIKSEAVLREAVSYIVEQTTALCRQVTGATYSIASVSVFAHDEVEYLYLCDLLSTLGTSVGENKGPRVKLHTPIAVGSNTVTYLRIRIPADTHPQVGCADFEVGNYDAFKREYLETHQKNLRLIVRPDYELIEFFDDSFDVLAYVLSEPERSTRGA